MDDAAIHWVSEDVTGLSLQVVKASGSARAYALAMTRGIVVRGVCHCEEDSMRDAAIHRVSEDANGNCGLFTSPPFTFHPSIFTLLFIESEWIATGFALAMARRSGNN